MKAINEVVRKLETVANGDRQLEVRKIRQHRSEYGSHTTYQDLDKALNAYELGEIDKSELRLAAIAHIEELKLEASNLEAAIQTLE